uniref:Uncharacterized protein LOC114341655 n=1 Tax=Diabrotica virgifera virgifera TaxID=50390 RepID=A0A6P7GSJ8_DIAVI
MEMPSEQIMIKSDSEPVTKPVPRPFSIEALMSDCGPRRNTHFVPWEPQHQFVHNNTKDTDSEESVEMDLVQDLSNRSQKDGK